MVGLTPDKNSINQKKTKIGYHKLKALSETRQINQCVISVKLEVNRIKGANY